MATVSSTFTGTGQSASLVTLAEGEDITVTITGTFVATMQLEREMAPNSGSWEPVLGPITSTGTFLHPVKHRNEVFRLNCTEYTSGTVTYSFSDPDKVIERFVDAEGNELFEITQAGIAFPNIVNVETDGNFQLGGTPVTSTAAELNILDGVTSTTAELNILDGVTSTAAELNLVDGSAAANSVASKAAILNTDKTILTDANNGTAGTDVTAVERGDGLHHTTVLTLSGVAATIGDNASLAGGALIYTLPAGALIVHSATMSVGLTLTTGTPTTDTPELGLGTTVGSGANATLGDVDAAAENILGPAAADDIAGTAELLTASPALVIEAAGDHTVYFNYADAWADVDDTAGTLDGTVVIEWTLLPV